MKVNVEEDGTQVNVIDGKVIVNTKEETAKVVLDSHIHSNKAILDAITGLPPQQLLLDEVIGCYFLIGG
jgi:hypothetical protein